MAFRVRNRIAETTSVVGTGAAALLGAVGGFRPFSVIGNGNKTYYTIFSDTQWEVGIGTYNSTGNTISRDFVLDSSSAGAKVNFTAGTKDIICAPPVEGLTLGRQGMMIHENVIDTAVEIPEGYNAISSDVLITDTGSVDIPDGSSWTIV